MDFNFDDFDFDKISNENTDDSETSVILDKKDDNLNVAQIQKSVSAKTYDKYLYNRFSGEKRLEELTDWEFDKNCAYHFITMGDIDSLSFLKFIIRQQKLEYCAVSTWGMLLRDITAIKDWIDQKRIENFDIYVGEIFRNRYVEEWDEWCRILQGTRSRICMFRNHTKIMICFGDKFDCVVESSANLNTNPRAENFVITANTELALFYKDFFDNIKSFERNFDDWKKYEIKR